jgi:FdrA protein
MIASVEIQPGRYHDSVRLMQASQSLQQVPGVSDALVAMATALNLSLLADMGFDPQTAAGAGPNDLLIAVRGEDDTAIAAARHALEGALAPKADTTGGLDAPAPRTVATAAAVSGGTIALISVPGEHAFVEAMEALDAGLHVMIFSDNVPLDQEIALKERGTANGLLVMGPDCGTAIVGGLGLGFANAVKPGPIGIVGASGTGIQELCCLLDDAGVGVRHALGTGSRDLSEPVGAVATLQALAALDHDPAVNAVAVVSKPPAPEVAARVRAAAEACSKPVTVIFMGETSLEAGANELLESIGNRSTTHASWAAPTVDHRPGTVRGLFSGGTLRDDARFVAAATLGEIGTAETAPGHTFVDYGDDRYTQGRAHPMIDQTVRIDRLQAAAADDSIGVALLDVVLGFGANSDPATELAPVVGEVAASGAAVVVSLCGTSRDPQDRDRQAAVLNEAGASVWLSNAAAARDAARLATRRESR